MLLMIPTHKGLPDWNEECWVSQELFTHLYEQFRMKIKGETNG